MNTLTDTTDIPDAISLTISLNGITRTRSRRRRRCSISIDIARGTRGTGGVAAVATDRTSDAHPSGVRLTFAS